MFNFGHRSPPALTSPLRRKYHCPLAAAVADAARNTDDTASSASMTMFGRAIVGATLQPSSTRGVS